MGTRSAAASLGFALAVAPEPEAEALPAELAVDEAVAGTVEEALLPEAVWETVLQPSQYERKRTEG